MKKALIALFLVMIVGAFVYLYAHHATPAGTISGAGQSATFYCDNSQTMAATFATSTVALKLSDGRSLMLPQTVSGSGIRYEASTTASDIVFSSEGNNAFLTENGKQTYSDCTAALVADSDAPGYETYTDPNNTFTFSFPSNFSVAGSPPGLAPGWSAPASTNGMVLAKIVVPQSFEPGTNFGNAWFTVGTSADPSAVATCLNTLSYGTGTTTAEIGGVTFTQLGFRGVGAGNYYDTTSYRTVRDNQCYAIEYTIHYANIQNYPSGAVKEFDETKVQSALDEVTKSFRFLGK